ncbi:MAG: acetyl-CoA C-acyltransferase [Chitinophagaceae bacterium]
MNPAYIIDACRTPVARFGGALASVRPDDLLARVIVALMERNPDINPAAIEDVIAGAANQAGEDNRNVARMSALLAGLPVTVAGATVNRLCASGLQAIMDASRQVICGEAELIIAAGTESMTRAPFVTAKATQPFQRSVETFDTTLGWRFINPALAEKYYPYTMGETAENVARRWDISRMEQDTFALSSQQKYFEALAAGKWQRELVGVNVKTHEGHRLVETDEHPRQSTLEKLAALKPAFVKDGTVTAGNSAGINDGAAAVLIASENAVARFGLKPMARILSMAITGVDPAIMGIGPVEASRKALSRAGLTIGQLDLIELNEAFASQSIACIRELGLPVDKVNVNGGSIAIGHPLGCSGVRISTTLLHEMARRNVRYGLATMCVGVGQGAAVIYENLM